MDAKDLKNTDDYIRILKDFDDHEKLRIINALSESMLNPQKKNTDESDEEFWSHFSAWEEDEESYEETIAKLRNARCSGLTRHLMEWD